MEPSDAARAARALALGCIGIGAVCLTPATARAQTSIQALRELPIEELANLEVMSVSKRPEDIAQAPAAIYVITSEDILRSGATSVPEMLRLAPNLQVAQTSASRYVITARGFNGVPANQNFSNKLLVLIDGRSVYSPLFSGMFWDMQDVLPEDIDRIEVISGPGATLWGANAVNGVINIITRSSSDTQGGVVAIGAGNQRRSASVRYGGSIGDELTYRLYAKTFRQEDTWTQAGAPGNDQWSKPQAGFRLDWTPSLADTITIQGDAYEGHQGQLGAAAEPINGGNLLARWNRVGQGGSQLQLQAYYDRARRGLQVDGASFFVDTFDLYMQHSTPMGARQEVVWGGGLRNVHYRVDGTETLQFSPASRTLKLSNLFVQDTITLNSQTKLILGMKLEDNPYVAPVLLPNVRLSWSPNANATLWAAASRAVRSPTPFDRDVVEILDGTLFLIGGSDFQTEKLVAYELGARIQPSPRASLSISTYYNVYDDLRSIELAPAGFLPLEWGNLMRGRTYGVEVWGDYQLTPWWRLSAAFNALGQTFAFKQGASRLVGVSQAATDPSHQASLKSSMNLGRAVTLDAALRYVAALPDSSVPDYVEMNGRIGWNVTEQVQFSVSGYNLLRDRHREYPRGSAIPRSVFAEMRLRY